MKIIHLKRDLSSTWYNKPTDTGLIMNYHALAPKRYKHSVVSGFVHRIYRPCSSWQLFHESLKKAKCNLERNQYPPTFYEPIIKQTLDSLVATTEVESATSPEQTNTEKKQIFVQYRGKVSKDYVRSLHRIKAP